MHSVMSSRGTGRARSSRLRTAFVVVSNRSTVSRSNRLIPWSRVVAVARLEATAGKPGLESSGHPAAVHDELRARDVRRVVAGEEERGGRDLRGLADARD